MTMQSRLATKVNRLFVSGSLNQILFPYKLSTSISGGGRTADPAVHAVDPEEKNDASEAAKAASSTNQSEFKLKINKDEDPYVPPKSPYSSSPKIQSTQQPQEPIKQQKRHTSSTSPCVTEPTKEEVNCAGLDGSPWPEDNQDRRSQRDEQEADDKGYFRHHKASPLSELEMADTRKPITRATDGTVGSYLGDYGSGVILWRPEQLDTAEDSLRRAMQIWKTNAMRGDPDSPHGRILRTLRGEYW